MSPAAPKRPRRTPPAVAADAPADGGNVPLAAGAEAPLSAYVARRAFDRTPEPPAVVPTDRSGPLLFVVQLHQARGLHHDLRLELGGVFKSFALPKGTNVVVGEKHLAVPTEDHPLAYGTFEGVIPAGQYGAGPVIVWDCGWFGPDETGRVVLDRAAAEAALVHGLAAGKLSITFLGAKLKGSYALVRMKDASWLLLKHRDAHAIRPAPADTLPRSVLSARTLETAGTAAARPVELADLAPHGPRERLPTKLKPMLAQAAPTAFTDAEWAFEPKLDGYRAIACVAEDGAVTLRSRGGQDLTPGFPGIVGALAAQPIRPLVLDGEIVAFEGGVPSFGALQRRAQLRVAADIGVAERTAPCVFFAFDVLHAHGLDLRGAPYASRRLWLTQLVAPIDAVQLVHADDDGAALHRAALAAGFEGTMAKRKTGRYRPGERSADWLKVKATQTAEFVVGGFTRGRGARRDRFGALVLGYFDDGRLRHAGEVGSGFDEATLASLGPALASRTRASSPFEPPPDTPGVTWVEPERVVEVRFAEWTESDQLRAPVFVRLREDRDAASVHEPRSSTTRAPATETEAAYVLQQLDRLGANGWIETSGGRIRVTHLDKVLWPATATTAAVTKRGLLAWLAAASPFMLEHLRDRPLNVIRMPEGIDGERFHQRHWDAKVLPATTRRLDAGAIVRQITCDDLATLVWLGQMGVLEFHPWHGRASADGIPSGAASTIEAQLARPDYIVFDLDPDKRMPGAAKPGAVDPAFALARTVAFHLKTLVEAMGLVPFVKTSGHRGLHVFVPIERTLEADAVRDLCGVIGTHLLREHPRELTMEHTPDRRPPGRVFFDHNMNGRGRTIACAYSPRATAGAPVSLPLDWTALASVAPSDLRIGATPGVLAAFGAPWRGMLAARRNLAQVLARPA